MPELENSVRELLHAAVPPDLEAHPDALIDGAVAYARRTRSAQTAGAVMTAVVLIAIAATTIWVGVQRPHHVPAEPAPQAVTSELCRSLQPTKPPERPLPGLSGDSAALCPTGAKVGPGWVLPVAPLELERWVDYLRGGIASTPSAACSTGPAGPAFVVVVKRMTGTRVSYPSSELACGGREVVARYLAALAYQQADRDAAATTGNAPDCSPPKPDEPIPLMDPITTLRAAHSPGILCAYPTFDPSSKDRLVARDYRAVHLSSKALAVINADLVTSTFSTHAPTQCASSRREVALRLETPDSHSPAGGQVEFVGACLDALRLPGNALWWQPDARTRATLEALLPAD